MGIAGLLTLALLTLAPSAQLQFQNAGGGDPYTGTKAQRSESGTHIELVDADTLRLWTRRAHGVGESGPWYEYASVSPCGGYPGRPGADDLCGLALALCLHDPGDGPAVAIFRREVDGDGAPDSRGCRSVAGPGHHLLP